MAYPDFDPLHPDPTTDNGSQAFTATRENMLALRDAALSGGLPGWNLSLSGGTAARRTNWTYAKGTERVRMQITWGGSGGTAGKPTAVAVSYSANSGSSWESIGTSSLSYNANGDMTGVSGLAPGLSAYWLLGLPEAVAGSLKASSNLNDLSNPEAARNALNLSNAATTTVANIRSGTTAGNVGLGNVRNVASYSQAEANARFWRDGNKASLAQLRNGTANVGVDPAGLYDANAPVTSSGSGNWQPNFNQGRTFRRTLTGNTTLVNPSNQKPGQAGNIYIRQDATGGRTLSIQGQWRTIDGEAPEIDTSPNARNAFAYYVEESGWVSLAYRGREE